MKSWKVAALALILIALILIILFQLIQINSYGRPLLDMLHSTGTADILTRQAR